MSLVEFGCKLRSRFTTVLFHTLDCFCVFVFKSYHIYRVNNRACILANFLLYPCKIFVVSFLHRGVTLKVIVVVSASLHWLDFAGTMWLGCILPWVFLVEHFPHIQLATKTYAAWPPVAIRAC